MKNKELNSEKKKYAKKFRPGISIYFQKSAPLEMEIFRFIKALPNGRRQNILRNMVMYAYKKSVDVSKARDIYVNKT